MDEFRLHEVLERIEELLRKSLAVQEKILAQILEQVGPNLPTGFDVRETKIKTGEQTIMKALKATVDLQILENGQVRYTLTPVDANGNPTALPAGTPPVSAVSSDPDLSLAIDTANDTTGLGLVWLGTAGKLAATGIVVTFSTTLPGASSPISTAADPVDVVPAPLGSPTGFVVAESAV
jgi:hypothetical protein